MLDLKLDGSAFGKALSHAARFSERLEGELETANGRIGRKVSGDAKREIQSEVMDVPIPLTRGANRSLGAGAKVRGLTTKGKHGKWKRTGNLLRLETFRLVKDGKGSSVVLSNGAQYAAARAALGQPNPPNRAGRKAGIQKPQNDLPPEERSQTRPVLWQQEAVKVSVTFIRGEYAAAVGRALKGRG